jgi:guanylate kinase
MPRVAPPDVDRVAAARAAVAARRARAAVKQSVASRDRTARDVAESAWAGEPTTPEATLRVRELLMSIPSLGPTRAGAADQQAGGPGRADGSG